MIRPNGATGGLFPEPADVPGQCGLERSRKLGDSKQSVRQVVRQRLASLSSEQRNARSSLICGRLRQLEFVEQAEQLVLYSALADEVDLQDLTAGMRGDRPRLYLPVSDRDSPRFRRWRPGEPVESGAFGALEPLSGEEPVPGAKVVLVPGRAFDSAGRRLGRGTGWYDRALAALGTSAFRLGVAFSCQLFEQVPVAHHDLGVDYLVTEDRVIDCRRDR